MTIGVSSVLLLTALGYSLGLCRVQYIYLRSVYHTILVVTINICSPLRDPLRNDSYVCRDGMAYRCRLVLYQCIPQTLLHADSVGKR